MYLIQLLDYSLQIDFNFEYPHSPDEDIKLTVGVTGPQDIFTPPTKLTLPVATTGLSKGSLYVL